MSKEETDTIQYDRKMMGLIWKKLNISTLIILKLFEKEIKIPIDSKGQEVPYSIHHICYEYGMINCYLDKEHKLLHILFDREVSNSDLNLVSSQYYNYMSRVFDAGCFHSVTTNDKIIKVSLKIPRKFQQDIDNIAERSTYSDLSNAFKTRMRPIHGRSIKEHSNPLSKYIVTKALPYAIVFKTLTLKKRIMKTLGVSSVKAEYYVLFDPSKEYWNDTKYSLYQ